MQITIGKLTVFTNRLDDPFLEQHSESMGKQRSIFRSVLGTTFIVAYLGKIP